MIAAMAILALAIAAVVGGIFLPGLAVAALAAPRADRGTRLAMAVPLGIMVLCVTQAAIVAAGLRDWAPAAGAILPAVAVVAMIAARRATVPTEDRGSGWAACAAAVSMGATWLVAARFWTSLDSISPAGTGVDDTPFHAACAAMFKIGFPAPDPTAEGFLQHAHFLVHLLGGGLSAMYGIEAYAVFVRVIPFLVAGTLAFQLAIAAQRLGGLRPAASALVAVLVVDGGTAAILAAPVLGWRVTANHFPLPLPSLLWKLPGLGVAMLFMFPALLLADRRDADARIGTRLAGWTVLAVATCVGMCAAKPVAPIVFLAGLAAAQGYALLRTGRPEGSLLPFTSVMLAAFVATAALSYDAAAYGYDQSPFGPLTTAMTTFRIDKDSPATMRIVALAASLIAWMPLTAIALVAWLRSGRASPDDRSRLLGIACAAGVAGTAAFLVLWSPMGAEFQFVLAGKLLADAAGATAAVTAVSRWTAGRRGLTTVAAALAATVLLAPVATRAWLDRGKPDDRREGPRELDRDTVEAMRWLRANSGRDETILLSNQADRNGTANSAVAIAISERQAYLACMRYSPGAYVPMSRGEPAPLAPRAEEARLAFAGDRAVLERLRRETRVRWLVRDRRMGERFADGAIDAVIGPPAFRNERFEIHRLADPSAVPPAEGATR
jgi:hypothetical protein